MQKPFCMNSNESTFKFDEIGSAYLSFDRTSVHISFLGSFSGIGQKIQYHPTHLFRNNIPELDILQAANWRSTMVVNQFVKRIELHNPQEELARRIPKHFEMLHTIWTSEERRTSKYCSVIASVVKRQLKNLLCKEIVSCILYVLYLWTSFLWHSDS